MSKRHFVSNFVALKIVILLFSLLPPLLASKTNGTVTTITHKNSTSALVAANAEPTVEAAVVEAVAAVTPVPVAIPLTTTRRPILSGIRLPCSCKGIQCGCCSGMILERFKQKACMNLTYDADETSVTASMSMNERVLYKNTFSGKNPEPMCIRVPRFRFIEFCVEFSNIYFAKRNIHMCIDAEASWEDFSIAEWSFDCIRLGASGVAVLGPEEGGGLPVGNGVDEEDEIEDYDENVRSEPLGIPDKKKVRIEKLPNGFVQINFK